MPAGSWTGQAGCTHQGGVASDGDQPCPSGAAVLPALLPGLFGRGEVVAVPRIPEPAGRAELASPCISETQPGKGQLSGAATSPQPKGQEGDTGQQGCQPTQRTPVAAWWTRPSTCPCSGVHLLHPSPSSPAGCQGRWVGCMKLLAWGKWVGGLQVWECDTNIICKS